MLPSLAIAAILLLCNLLTFGAGMHFIVRFAVRELKPGFRESLFYRDTAVMAVMTLIMTAVHLTQIGLWAVTLDLCGVVPSFGTAVYLSAQDYTALGYGDIQLSEQWRLLGPLEAINGLLFFGISTAVLFAVMSRLIENRVRAEAGDDAGNGNSRISSVALKTTVVSGGARVGGS
jgi:hypothetical protein